MSLFTPDASPTAVIPLALHHNLATAITGRLWSVRHHGPDVEFLLEDGARFWTQLDEAQQLVRLAGPHPRGRQISYDGHRVVLSRGA
jgi:hypothetical protein